MVIPNRKIVGEVLHNYGKLRQLDLLIGVAYSTDIQKALMVARDVLTQNDRVTKDIAPIVGVTLLGEKSVGIAIKPWVAVTDYVPAVGELNQALVEAFRTHRSRFRFRKGRADRRKCRRLAENCASYLFIRNSAGSSFSSSDASSTSIDTL